MTSGFAHTPVLLAETTQALQPRPGGRFIDATVGGGGHAEKVLELSSPTGALLALDADPAALEASRIRLARFGPRVVFAERYSDRLLETAREYGFIGVDGVLFDLGVSSPQLDAPERGFSFQQDAPLDMRFGPSVEASAAELVNRLSEARLREIIGEYGEERYAGRIAHRIVAERTARSIQTTSQLADIVTRAKPRNRSERIHPATRVFQALRIAVNDELGRLRRALPQSIEVLRNGGRLAVISFHSLEDRIVKQFMRQEARGCICPPELPSCVCGRTPRLRIITPHPLVAGEEEISANPRARSAKLRVAERLNS
ncbi:MAG TPA: 16S rRNA (cytosine(1402)-N(4))-methyltransferase RsmH [Chloroflexota bacterium]